MEFKKIRLRAERKEFERRTPLTPSYAKQLVDMGFIVEVEDDPSRIFTVENYKESGCQIVKAHTWEQSDKDTLILGLKEIPPSEQPLVHHHIYFAHIFKNQPHAKQVKAQYKEGGGHLYDLEYLVDKQGRRISAFGFWAGFVGAALALEHFLDLRTKEKTILKSYDNQNLWLKKLEEKFQKNLEPEIKTLIVGALGRCGSGSRSLFRHFNIEVDGWDREKTLTPGPYQEILDFDIFCNTVLMREPTAPFLTKELIQNSLNHKLNVICDISCDPGTPQNPLPIYDHCTSWSDISQKIHGINLISIDNLPSALPLESSLDFSAQLFPHLLDFITDGIKGSVAFQSAQETFFEFMGK